MICWRSQFRLNRHKLNRWYVFWITLSLLLSPASLVFSNPLDEFCLTQKWVLHKAKTSSGSECNYHPPLIVNFTAGGKAYYLIQGRTLTCGKGGPNKIIELYDEYDNLVSLFYAKQEVTGIDYAGYILNLKMSKTGWLWINGEDIDYIARIDLKKSPPRISRPIDISSLIDENCISKPIVGCSRAVGIYSEALERIFVSSSHGAYFGLIPPLSHQIIDGVAEPLPSRLNNAFRTEGYGGLKFHFDDLPRHKGVVFKEMNSNEPLFYDGSKVMSLLHPDVYSEKHAIENSKIM